MWRRTLVVVLFGPIFVSPAASQPGERPPVVASLAEVELRAPHTRTCPSPEPPTASCHSQLEVQRDALPSRNARASWPLRVPEPPDWMVWLCGIAVAAVIAVRRIRGHGLHE
jgi:hypothetical protein